MSLSAGLFDKLFRNTGTHGTPVLVEVDNIESLKISDERNEITVKLRSFDTETVLTGQRKLSFEAKMACDSGNANWAAVQTAYLNHTTIELFAFYKYIDDGGQPDTGSKAIRAECHVTSFPIDQPLEDVDTTDVTFKPSANAAYEPDIYTVP